MNRGLKIFIFRAAAGGVFAVLLTRFFHPETTAAGTAGLAVLLVGLGYLFEYLRNRKSGE
ncbi:MAG: hypothetical protein ACOZBW_07035 [Thermodesulfobacteriota bacterium]